MPPSHFCDTRVSTPANAKTFARAPGVSHSKGAGPGVESRLRELPTSTPSLRRGATVFCPLRGRALGAQSAFHIRFQLNEGFAHHQVKRDRAVSVVGLSG